MSGQVCAQGESPSPLSLKSLLEGDLARCDRVPALALGTTAHVGESFMCQGATCLHHVSSGEGSVGGLEPSETHPITTI